MPTVTAYAGVLQLTGLRDNLGWERGQSELVFFLDSLVYRQSELVRRTGCAAPYLRDQRNVLGLRKSRLRG